MRNDTIKSHCGNHDNVEISYFTEKCPLCAEKDGADLLESFSTFSIRYLTECLGEALDQEVSEESWMDTLNELWLKEKS